MSVRRAQTEISAKEFAEWIALEQMEPTGPERDDIRFAMLAAIVGQIAGGKGDKVFKQFMQAFDFDNQKKGQTAEQMKSMLMGFTKQVTAMANG